MTDCPETEVIDEIIWGFPKRVIEFLDVALVMNSVLPDSISWLTWFYTYIQQNGLKNFSIVELSRPPSPFQFPAFVNLDLAGNDLTLFDKSREFIFNVLQNNPCDFNSHNFQPPPRKQPEQPPILSSQFTEFTAFMRNQTDGMNQINNDDEQEIDESKLEYSLEEVRNMIGYVGEQNRNDYSHDPIFIAEDLEFTDRQQQNQQIPDAADFTQSESTLTSAQLDEDDLILEIVIDEDEESDIVDFIEENDELKELAKHDEEMEMDKATEPVSAADDEEDDFFNSYN